MKAIKLPQTKMPSIPSKKLSMDDYLAFVELGWRNLQNKSAVLENRLKNIPTVRFSLR